MTETTTLDSSGLDLLMLVRNGPIRTKDARMDPMTAIDMMDAGFVKIDRKEASVSITDSGLTALQGMEVEDAERERAV